jgi:hypothetical protein
VLNRIDIKKWTKIKAFIPKSIHIPVCNTGKLSPTRNRIKKEV